MITHTGGAGDRKVYRQKSLNRSGDSSVALVHADIWLIGRAQLRNQRQDIGRLLDQL
jgi:hypothetical protein